MTERAGMRARGLWVLTLVAGLGGGLAACGDVEQRSEAAQPPVVALTLTGEGKNVRFEVPSTVPGGVVRLAFTNATGAEGTAQLVRVDAGHTVQEGLKAAGAWADDGKALPPWVHLVGGLGFIDGGGAGTSTQRLSPGAHVVFDIESETSAAFTVTSEKGQAELPAPTARIRAFEYGFDAAQLTAGRHAVLVDNRGREPHVIGAAPIKPGKTIADVRRYSVDEKGEDPTDPKGTFETAILDGGERQVIELDFRRPGNYVLLCYVPDRKGGPPHLVKGMISQGVVR